MFEFSFGWDLSNWNHHVIGICLNVVSFFWAKQFPNLTLVRIDRYVLRLNEISPIESILWPGYGMFPNHWDPKPPTSNHWLKPMEVQGCRCTRCLASQPISQGWGLAWQPTASWWWTVDTCRCIETMWKNMWVHWKNGGLKSEFQILDF